MNFYVDILANLIIQQYFLNSRCLLVFSDNVNRFEYNGDLPIVNIRVNNSNHVHSGVFLHYFGCQGIVIKTNKPLTLFANLEREIKLIAERFNYRKYLFLPGDNLLENLSHIYSMQELKYIADVVIVNRECKDEDSQGLYMSDNVFSLWTHSYRGMDENAKRMFLDLWFSKNQSFMLDENLYPDKLVNQMGRKLEMATFQYEPYSIIGSSETESKGSEMVTCLTFARHYNMTPVLVVNDEGYWGDIFDNWTGYGLLGNLVEDKADIGFSALYTWESDYYFLDLSKPLVRTGITCLVPAPSLAAGWTTPLYSFSTTMWAAVGSMFFVCIFVQFFMHYFHAKIYDDTNQSLKLLDRSILCVLKPFVQQVVTTRETPPGRSGKYFMGLLFTFSLFLSSSYSSGLSSIMTIPRYGRPINTVEEFAESKISWGATQDAWTMSLKGVEDPTYKAIVNKFVATNEETLREFSKTSNFAFSLERLPNKNYAIGSYIQKDVIGNYHLMQEDFYWEECVVMMRKSSILLPLLDMFILRVFETGLISYWQNEATSLYMDAHVQRVVKFYYYKHQNRNFVVKLKWVHVEGAFGILCMGHIVSLLLFLIEHVCHRVYHSKMQETKDPLEIN